MPTYGYQCKSCKFEFSVFQNMKDDPIKICPECQSEVVRLLYPVGIVFKGSGWYINDSRKPESKSDSNGDSTAEKAEKSDSSSKDSTSTDSSAKESTAKKDDSSSSNTESTPKTDTSIKKEPAAASAPK